MSHDIFVDVQIALPRQFNNQQLMDAFGLFAQKKAKRVEADVNLRTLLEAYLAEFGFLLATHCVGNLSEEELLDKVRSMLQEAKKNFTVSAM